MKTSFFPLSRMSTMAGAVAACCVVSLCPVQGAELQPPLKVMSFNIRYGAANDGENSWPHRKDLVVETIKTFDPDLLGMQEVLGFQAEFVRAKLPGYAFHGVGREDGVEKGEYVPVMYKTDRFELLEAGHFWLSETPDIPGSNSWDSSLPRMVSWVMLLDRPSDTAFVFGNAHFDHRGSKARAESAKVIRRRAAPVVDQYPVILTGDFNTTEDREPYAVLLRGEGIEGGPWVDSYRVIHPRRSPLECTFGAWKGVRQGGRIDWIVHTPDVLTLNAMIDYTNQDGRYPSDHYPVQAVLRFR